MPPNPRIQVSISRETKERLDEDVQEYGLRSLSEAATRRIERDLQSERFWEAVLLSLRELVPRAQTLDRELRELADRVARGARVFLLALALLLPGQLTGGPCHVCFAPPSGERRGPRIAYVHGRRRRPSFPQ